MDNIILHIYHENIFKEIDLKSISKTTITFGGHGADICIDEKEVGYISFEKETDGIYITSNDDFFVQYGGKHISKKEVKLGDIFYIRLKNNQDVLAVILAKNKDEYPEPDTLFKLKNKDTIKIGRAKDNDIVFDDRMVSETHAQIVKKDGKYIIQNMKSRNGLFVNGIKTEEKELQENDLITISGHKLKYSNTSLLVADTAHDTKVQNISLADIMLKKEKPEYPYFQRSPRLMPQMPDGEIEIPSPPMLSSEPSINWLSVLLPAIGMLLLMIIIVAATSSSGGSGSPMVAIYIIFPIISVVTAYVNYKSQTKKHEEESDNRQGNYSAMLNSKRKEIIKNIEMQQNALNTMNPDIKTKVKIVDERQRRMWERTPQHDDFLGFRLGTGNIPFCMDIKLPASNEIGPSDPLLTKAQSLKKQYNNLSGAPVILNLQECSPLGVIGKRADVLSASRNIILDLAIHHSYDEMKMIIIFDEDEKAEWEALRWIPHIFDNDRKVRYMASNKRDVKNLLDLLYEEIRIREISSTYKEKQSIKTPAYVFVIASQSLVQNERLMSYLIQANKELGVFSVLLFDKLNNLPTGCSSIIEIAGNKGNLLKSESHGQEQEVDIEKLGIKETEYLTRSMAPVRLKQIVDDYNLPSSITFFDLYGIEKTEELDIVRRWETSEPYTGLEAAVGTGQSGQKQMIYFGESAKDYGIHGLIAGTIGSGKSEFIQSLILSLAINYNPNEIAFVLVDYKGGAMANVFKDLPHLAGIITNLGGTQTNRALISINSEVRRRQMILDQAKVDHIHKYQRLYRNGEVDEPLPHLFLIVDEFAELKTEKPEFISGLVSAARLGRSLGIKLILATQKPMGVVDEQIRSNTGYNICLKVQTPEDSKEVISTADAALINLPGRAYIKVGTKNIYNLFQSAWSGADYMPTDDARDASIYEVVLNGVRKSIDTEIFKTEYKESKTQLQVLVNYINKTAGNLSIQKARNIWLEPLPETLYIEELYEHSDNSNPIIGLVDNPKMQLQHPLEIDFNKTAHLAIYGAPSTGKTTLLQTLIVSASKIYSSEEFNFYILDFGVRALKIFGNMPHIGGVVTADETERIQNLFKFLVNEINNRKKVFEQYNVSNITSYKNVSKSIIPQFGIIIDNYPALMEVYPEFEENIIQISREGSNLGIYLILTANTKSDIKYKVSTNINNSIALHMTDNSEYASIVGRTDGLVPGNFAGRGLVSGNPPLEFQAALPIKGMNETEVTSNIREHILELNRKWDGKKARPIPEMPKELNADYLIEQADKTITKKGIHLPLGINYETISPVFHNFSDSEHLLVTGNARMGKSTFLKSLVFFINHYYSKKDDAKVYIFDSRIKALKEVEKLKCIKGYSTIQKDSEEMLSDLINIIEERKKDYYKDTRTDQKNPEIFIIVDDYYNFAENTSQEKRDALENFIRRERGLKFHLIMCGALSDITSAWEGLIKSLKELQTGLVFASAGDQQIYNIRLPYNEMNKPLKTGDCYYVNKGEVKRLKTART